MIDINAINVNTINVKCFSKFSCKNITFSDYKNITFDNNSVRIFSGDISGYEQCKDNYKNDEMLIWKHAKMI